VRTLKVALCIPVYGMASSRFLFALLKMATFTMRARIEMEGKPVQIDFIPLLISCSMLAESRNRLVMEALHADADYMLWMDADHVFPEDALVRLLGRSKPVVGCNYARRSEPTWPTGGALPAADGTVPLLYTTAEKAAADEVEEISHVGLGFCLMHMSIFGALQDQADRDGKEHFWPLFYFEMQPGGIKSFGEDVFFFRRLREAGVPVFCDHALSWEVGHCHEVILTNAHTIAQRAQWEAWNRTKLDKFEEGNEADGK
jgi:hypothetical protein